MPFTETQPINIHDLVVEQPEAAKTQLKYEFSDFEIDQLRFVDRADPIDTIGVELDRKILLGPDYEKSENVIKAFRALEWNKKKGISNIITNRFFGKLLGIENQPLTPGEIQRATAHLDYLIGLYKPYDHHNSYVYFQQLRFLGVNAQPPKTFTGDLYSPVTNNDWSAFNNDEIVDECSTMKLFGLPLPFTQKLQYSEEYLQQNKYRNPNKYFSAIADMMILEADEIIIGDNGLELYKSNTDLTTTPPIPTVKNF